MNRINKFGLYETPDNFLDKLEEFDPITPIYGVINWRESENTMSDEIYESDGD